jgi:hypothetical protein
LRFSSPWESCGPLNCVGSGVRAPETSGQAGAEEVREAQEGRQGAEGQMRLEAR